MEAARRRAGGGHVERAELLLLSASRSQAQDVRAAGLVALARMYEKESWYQQAMARWQQLAAEHSGTMVEVDGQSIAAGELADRALGQIQSANRPGQWRHEACRRWQNRQLGGWRVRDFNC
ncbi:MAG: hypothetical protein HC898_05315 [Phycisphaerales bacterium]|nr:hypothetical protein [Phycisphaerales bacterium]